MKKIIILFFFIFFQNRIAQKSELFGKITLQNSGGQPLSGVQVSAIDASPTSSLSNGLFKLVFNSLKPGDPVTITIEKHGFDIVNSKDLELLILRNNPKTNVFKIVMCKEGEKEKKQMEYYNISSNYYNELIEKFEDILKYRNSTEVDLQVTKDSLAYVKKMWKSKQLIINELSEKFSEINLDDIDSLYKVALVNFKKGNTQKAQKILNPIVLQTNISSAKLELARLSIFNNEIQLRKSNAKKILKNAVDGYILKADMFTMTFKFDSSEFYYEKAIEADSTNINSYITYHLYLSKQNQHEKALEIGKKALLFTKEVYDSVIVCQFIGISYYNILDYYNSESYLIQALKHWVSCRDSDPSTYDNQYVSIHRSLGNTYIELGHYEKAESSYKNCQRIIDLLKKNNMKEYDEEHLSLSINFGRLYAIKKEFDKSENYYSNALKHIIVLPKQVEINIKKIMH
ncbi:MAG: hypothetical protein GY936_08375 [Ignavibacteriae bacterium]|nr:hypothetical protein [Ignavibacteriota bacterium]